MTTVAQQFGEFVAALTLERVPETKRKFGFHECMDTERMFFALFDYYRREKVLP